MSIKLIGGAFLEYVFNNLITHIPIHVLRLGFLRLFNRKIHKDAIILMHTRILHFWNIEIGARSVINQYCLLDCRRFPVRIAQDVDIGPYSRIWTLGHDPDSSEHALYGKEIVIEDHVWIASGVTILPGVKLGRGAVVSAASVVHKDVGAMEIVAGNPAKRIRDRLNTLNYQLNYRPILE